MGEGAAQMATIKEIASLSGVSRGTVDRVLNERGLVHPDTAAKVWQIARALNYTPNKVGRSLATVRKHFRIAFVIFSNTHGNPFFDDVIEGIRKKEADLRDLGIEVEQHFTPFGEPGPQVELMDRLLAEGVHGLAITPVNHPDVAAKIKECMTKGVPVVTSNTDIEGSDRLAYVGSDYAKGGQTAAGLMGLITGGNARVGIVSGSGYVLCHSERVTGFSKLLGEKYPDMEIVQVVENRDDDICSFEVTKKLLGDHPDVDALYLVAAGVYGACRAVQDLGLAGRVAIISHDTVPTTLTLLREGVIAATIGQQPQKQGSRPLEILADYLTTETRPGQDYHYCAIDIRIRENC